MDADAKNQQLVQLQTDLSLISFLTVISVFFTGALLSQFNSYDFTVKIPISFLVISTFAFLFSALILSNATLRVIAGETDVLKKYLTYGYAISEYLGVFLFVLSVPLAVSIITGDLYLRIVTFLAALAGLGFYQFMGFSLLENHFSKNHRFYASITMLFGIALFLAQVFEFYFVAVSAIFLLFLVVLTFLAPSPRFQ